MFSTNIVTVNNFYKRLASVFIAIALMMMTSMLVACGKKEDIEDKGDDQFEISDGRSVDEVFNALKDHGLQPVMNDYIYL